MSHFKITLKRGTSYTTPWGFRFRAGVPLTLLAGDPKLVFFNSSARFDVAAIDTGAAGRRAEREKRDAELAQANKPRKTNRRAAAPSQLHQPERVEAARPPGVVVAEPEDVTPKPKEAEEDSDLQSELDELSRNGLRSKAKELGLSVKSTDSKAAIRKRIVSHLDGGNQSNASEAP